MKCPKCKTKVDKGAINCKECGINIAAASGELEKLGKRTLARRIKDYLDRRMDEEY